MYSVKIIDQIADKIRNMIYEMEKSLYPLQNDLYKRFYNKYDSECYYNGINAIDSLIEQKGKELIKLPIERVKEIAEQVFMQNKKALSNTLVGMSVRIDCILSLTVRFHLQIAIFLLHTC